MKKIFVILAAAALAFSANAQEANENLLIGNAGSNWFISVNGGVNFMYNAKSWSKPTNPAVAINLGKWFTPAIGFRVGSDMTARVNDVITEMITDGTLAAIAQKYDMTDLYESAVK